MPVVSFRPSVRMFVLFDRSEPKLKMRNRSDPGNFAVLIPNTPSPTGYKCHYFYDSRAQRFVSCLSSFCVPLFGFFAQKCMMHISPLVRPAIYYLYSYRSLQFFLCLLTRKLYIEIVKGCDSNL